jgi:hypothetical protein
MNRDDIADLLAIASSFDKRTVDPMMISTWLELLERFSKDECLDAVMAHQAESTEYLLPAHVIRRAKDKRNDLLDRADPDDRPHLVGLEGQRRDRYGVVIKGETDEIEYPADWTSQQRIAQIENRRDSQSLTAESWDQTAPHMPAHEDVRADCMAHIRAMLQR